MTNPVAIVTGASSGIGASTVRQLLERGYIVYFANVDQPGKASHPDIVGLAIVKAVTAARPRARYIVGSGARTAIFGRWLLSDKILDRIISQRMGIGPRNCSLSP